MVFDSKIEVKMKLNASMCNLFKKKLEFLGFEISTTEEIGPIKSKVDAIQLIESPKDNTGVRDFINLVGFYSRHIHQFAQRSLALTNLLKKNAPFIWTQGHQRKFDSLKKAVANAAMLRYPDPNLKYSVYCDAL